jgi:hypothetical protein
MNVRLRRLFPIAFFAALGGCCADRPAPERPQPPYARFAGLSFEPSAAAYDPATDRVLVLSDRDAIVYRYELTKQGALTLAAGELHRALYLPGGAAAAKFEAMTALADGSFLAATAFDREDPAYRRVVRFRFAKEGLVPAVPVPLDEAAIARAVRAATGRPWFKVEGIAADAAPAHVFLGVRNVGRSYREPEDVVLVLRCPFDSTRIGAPEAVFFFSTRAALGADEGLSDIQRDPRGEGYWILTSREVEPDAPGSHGGHLFRLPAAALEGRPPESNPAAPAGAARAALPAPVRAFSAKSEGLATLADGRLLVVFDDDRDWKHLFAGYEQSEGLFEVFRP